MHASYRVYLTATLLASLLTVVNPPLTYLLRTEEFRSDCVLMDSVWFSEQKIKMEMSINLSHFNSKR